MRESPFIREIVERAWMEAKRADILAILQRRFGAEADEALAARLDECTDLDRLHQLFAVALDCATLEEFRRALP
jgi:hypothetical protein